MHRGTGAIGCCEFGVVRRKFWDAEDLERSYFQKDQESTGHSQLGTCEGSHKLWPYRS